MNDSRAHLVQALRATLIGPYSLDTKASEVLRLNPTRWYLTGFLAPINLDSEDDDDLDAGNDELAVEGEDAGAVFDGGDIAPRAQRSSLPSSLGMSVLVPSDAEITATVRFAQYRRISAKSVNPEETKRDYWRRVPTQEFSAPVPLDRERLETRGIEIAPGVLMKGTVAKGDAVGLPVGTLAVSLFVVNQRTTEVLADEARDEGDNEREQRLRTAESQSYWFPELCIFQMELELSCKTGFVGRSNPRGARATDGDHDDGVLDLQFRHHQEWATGHGVAVEAFTNDGARVGYTQGKTQHEPVTKVRTTFLPSCEVRKVAVRPLDGVCLRMEELSRLEQAEVNEKLGNLPAAYKQWIAEQASKDVGTSKQRRAALARVVDGANAALYRIEEGIALLATNKEALEAFRVMNQAMALQSAQRARVKNPEKEPKAASWRVFQLAFVLLSLKGMIEPEHEDRKLVDLIFFPTGGGKTEAYLGVIGFTLLLRRLRGQSRPDKGLGVAVVLRYTLRLLTLDQLSRASTLICALETIRKERAKAGDPSFGAERFAIGLWVGSAASPNELKQAQQQIAEFGSGRGHSPFSLTNCPWCGEQITPASLNLVPARGANKDAVRAACMNSACEFAAAKNPQGLPVLFVDEHIYKELPAFLVATVDKFAMLPWRAQSAALFGTVNARRQTDSEVGPVFLGSGEKAKKNDRKLDAGLLPPELIVQDELHLISGPLGTMVGLYETGVLWLASRGGTAPKVIASTATVRRADAQVRALYGRAMRLFPPPGADDSDTFFGQLDKQTPGRLYVGVAAPGRAMKKILIETYYPLLSAAQKLVESGVQNADAYMTLVGYFNSLRELGGMRRLVEDEIAHRVEAQADERMPVDASKPHAWLSKRKMKDAPEELTSRKRTDEIATAKALLERTYKDPELVDVVLASNMISVGVDIDRLGLMVVAGQPKSTSEYIQASSRVGRQADKPGLVVTVYNTFKPRDRSHFERFSAYHECFYRYVEATSVTPFSASAIDRGLAGVLVMMIRLASVELAAPDGLRELSKHKDIEERVVEALCERARSEPGDGTLANTLGAIIKNHLSAWRRMVEPTSDEPPIAQYSPLEGKGTSLLHHPLEDGFDRLSASQRKFLANTSMRDVEPTVHVWKKRYLSRHGAKGGRRG